MIGILDYGAGNLRSVENTLERICVPHELARDREELQRASKIILPGVGHFGQMMRALDRMQVRNALLERIRAGIPFLGICLGLQALFEGSEEAPGERGLGLFQGCVRRFGAGDRVPHMGWNELEMRPDSKLLDGLGLRPYLYFAHSYYVPEHEYTTALCTYSAPFTAVFEHRNVFGVQCHPEKSGPLGLRIMKNFAEL